MERNEFTANRSLDIRGRVSLSTAEDSALDCLKQVWRRHNPAIVHLWWGAVRTAVELDTTNYDPRNHVGKYA